MRRMLLAVLAVFPACISTTTPRQDPVGPYRVIVKERFRVMQGERLLGHLIYVQVADQRYFRVEMPSGGWVGDIRKYGRLLKSVPFRDLPREIGVYPQIGEGLARLFEVDGPLRILPLDGEGRPAEAAANKLLKKAMADRDR